MHAYAPARAWELLYFAAPRSDGWIFEYAEKQPPKYLYLFFEMSQNFALYSLSLSLSLSLSYI
jgi:hypothetical protein